MVQKVVGSIPISHPISRFQFIPYLAAPPVAKPHPADFRPDPFLASVVQRLVYKFSKLGMRFRLPPLAPTRSIPPLGGFLFTIST